MNTRRVFIRNSSLGAMALAGINNTFSSPAPQDAKQSPPAEELLRDAGMQLSLYMNTHSPRVSLARQIDVGAVTSITAGEGVKPWEAKAVIAERETWKKLGIPWTVVEGPPSFGPKTKLGLEGRDEEIDHFIEFMKNLKEHGGGVDTIGYGWQLLSWPRTNLAKPGRGGALVTEFNYEEMKDAPLTEHGEVSMDTMWKSLEYFLKAVIPEAEKHGIKLAMHPSDPVIPSLRGIARNMITVDAFKRMIDIYPSPSNGILFCQGNFALMDEIDLYETIRYFGKKKLIHFVHFRNVTGNKWRFQETFHDEGMIDMQKAMQAYYDIGFRGAVRPDHVPTMAGDNNDNPGYTVFGTLYPIGYIRGLMEAIDRRKLKI